MAHYKDAGARARLLRCCVSDPVPDRLPSGAGAGTEAVRAGGGRARLDPAFEYDHQLGAGTAIDGDSPASSRADLVEVRQQSQQRPLWPAVQAGSGAERGQSLSIGDSLGYMP